MTVSKHRFSYVERYALWRTYDGRCFYCEKPLDFQDMTIDHVIPEWLAEEPEQLRQVRRDYEIDENFPDFQINDFTNWVPAHPRKCNVRKGPQVFPKKMTLLLLRDVQQHLHKVREELEVLSRNRTRAHLFGSLSAAIENRRLTIQEIHGFLAEIENSQHAEEPLVLTFSLMIDDVLSSDLLPEDVPREYPYLCDWLELDLVKRLRAVISTSFHYTQPSERWGDGLSVRMVFPGLNESELDKFDPVWWEILEAANFWEIFGERYRDAFPNPPKQEYFGQLEGTDNDENASKYGSDQGTES
jgi:hypothetical protein